MQVNLKTNQLAFGTFIFLAMLCMSNLKAEDYSDYSWGMPNGPMGMMEQGS